MAESVSKSQLCELYGVNILTLKSWFIRAGLIGEGGLFSEDQYRKIRLFTPRQVEKIYQVIGDPE